MSGQIGRYLVFCALCDVPVVIEAEFIFPGDQTHQVRVACHGETEMIDLNDLRFLREPVILSFQEAAKARELALSEKPGLEAAHVRAGRGW